MVVVLFRSRLNPDAGDDYSQMAEEMYLTAKTMPGFVDFRHYTAEDGERLAVVWWQDHETMATWRNHPRHRIAQQNGRSKWYASYNIEVADVVRHNAFERKASAS